MVRVFLQSVQVNAEETPVLKSQEDKLSYAIGIDTGRTFKKQSVDLDPDILARGMKDGTSGEKVAMNLSFQNVFTQATTQNGNPIPDTQLNMASVFLGGSYRLTRHVSLHLNVGIRATSDSPDFQVQLNVPIFF